MMVRMLPFCAWLAIVLAASAEAGSIAGRVTGPGGPLPEICVAAINAADASDFAGSDLTDAAGDYRIEELPAGSYKLHFSECLAAFRSPDEQPTHAPEWYDDQHSFETADPVAVGEAEDVTGLDATLAVGGILGGEATEEETGAPLRNGVVSVFGKDTSEFGYDLVDSSGRYEIRGLPADEYYVIFDTFVDGVRRRQCQNEPVRQTEVYDDVPYIDDFALPQATLVPVALGATTSGIDAALAFAAPADLAVTSFTVTGAAPGSTGPRTIDVTVENLGLGTSLIAWLEVEVCGRTLGCSRIGESNLSLLPGRSDTKTFTWNPSSTLSVGDVEVRAHAWNRNDAECSNNHDARPDAVHVEGVGAGVSLLSEGSLP